MKNIKKLFGLILVLAMALSLVACGSKTDDADTDTEAPAATEENAPVEENTDTEEDAPAAASYKIAIVQQLDHASLDEIRLAIEAELDAQAAEKGIAITYSEFNGQNDPTILAQIGSQVVDGGYDAVIPIATLAAQTMVTAVEDHPIPVVFAAITDPEAAGLTGIDYVTGISDALNTPFIMDMMFAQNPDIQTVGLLYSNSEINSAAPIAEAKAYLEDKGIAYVEKTGNTTDEIQAAVSSLVGEVDAIFTPTDNVVMAAELSIYETLYQAGIPHYTGADSFVRNGAFATCGVNYTDLGTYTADMAVDVLLTGNVPEYHVMEGGIITVNTETASALNADYSVFSELAGTVNEVITTED
ncbi:MAG: ABC transporter substrate-binding protein [Oscillospiraceae bacterium]|nr:ABC transporter substrate-binding protein [Oscillospiraceae bacterium]